MDIIYKVPSEISQDEINIIYSLVVRGNKVNPQTLMQRLLSSALIGYVKINDKIVATSAIKQPTKEYRDSVFAKANVVEYASMFDFELGFFFIEEEHRGKKIASNLCDSLCKKFVANNIYAATRTTNFTMHRILTKNGFVPIGTQYKNRDGTADLILFIKNI